MTARWIWRGVTADAGSLPLALLFILVATSLAALMSPLATIQITQARQENQRSHGLHAALAGLEVALNAIRNASDTSGNGVLASLPGCNGTISGTLGSTGYTVTVYYL